MPPRRNILIVNPNTSVSITEAIDALVRSQLEDHFAVRTATAEFGFQYISSRAAMAVAGHAVLDTVAKAVSDGYRPDAILLACFGDPGMEGLAEMCDVPVVGFAEAGLRAASELQGAFIAATRGEVWCEVIWELAQKLGIGDKLAGVETLDSVGEDPKDISAFLTRRVQETGASRVLIGGAGLIPKLDAIIAAAGVPVLDAHRAAISKAAQLAQTLHRPAPARFAAARVAGISGHLRQQLETQGLALAIG